MEKELVLSSCCNSKTGFMAPSFGEKGFYICDECSTECDVKIVSKYESVAKGISRPIVYTTKLGKKIK